MARSYARIDVQRFHDSDWRALTLAQKAVVSEMAMIPHGPMNPISTDDLYDRGAELAHLLELLDQEWVDWPSGGVVLSPKALKWISPVTDPARAWIPEGVRAAVYGASGYRCAHCGSDQNLSLDHIRPVSLGGSDDPENLQTLCRSCNSRKGAKWAG